MNALARIVIGYLLPLLMILFILRSDSDVIDGLLAWIVSILGFVEGYAVGRSRK